MRIARSRYLIAPRLLEATQSFYCELLGMTAFAVERGTLLGFDDSRCLLEFHPGAREPFYAGADGLYWKIGITLRDLDAAVAYLRERNWNVSDPRQFQEIGYMCHLHDPNGFPIELLQHEFEGRHRPFRAGGAHPVGGQATLAHVTWRIGNLAAARWLCEDRLAMRLLSVQPVVLPERAFTLYFYGWSQERLPDPDLEAIVNRPWLWARPYALLELQHLGDAPGPVRHRRAGEAGFSGLGMADGDAPPTYLADAELAGIG